MDKKSIFAKIDELYIKATKVIIGDIPHNDEVHQSTSKQTKTSTQANNELGIKHTLSTIKDKILNLGKPADEKTLLYKEVIKREKEEAKAKAKIEREAAKAKKTTRKKAPTKKSDNSAKATVKTTTSTKKTPLKKKTTSKATATTMTKKTAAKKPIAKTSISKDTSTKKSPTKKAATKKTATTSKKTVAKKPTAKPTGNKRVEKIALYAKDIKKHYGEVDEAFLTIIVKNLGPSIYKRDAETVACSDPKELDTVRKNFLMKKLQIDASQGVLDAAIQDVCEELKETRTKYRATFYYALAKKFKKESVLSGTVK